MAERRQESEVERVIVAAIGAHARGDVEKLARGIMLELHRAGYEIRPRPNAQQKPPPERG